MTDAPFRPRNSPRNGPIAITGRMARPLLKPSAMICASVPIWEVSAHLDTSLAHEEAAPPSVREERRARRFDDDCGDPTEPVFLLTSIFRRAA